MTKPEKMPEIKRYTYRHKEDTNGDGYLRTGLDEDINGIWCKYSDLESFCTQQAERIKELEEECNELDRMLSIGHEKYRQLQQEKQEAEATMEK